MNRYEAIVRVYVSEIQPRALTELIWFKKQPDLVSALNLAALAQNSKTKRYSHQRRLKKENLELARAFLLENIKSLKKCRNFDELFTFLEANLMPINGLGELYVYDTALRIGAKLDLMPQSVYLHAGTRLGAKALGFTGKEKTIEISAFPEEFQYLTACEIEDVLCIFKNELSRIKKKDPIKILARRSWCD